MTGEHLSSKKNRLSMTANISIHPDIYHLYLNLNEAFNSIPHNALWHILSLSLLPFPHIQGQACLMDSTG